MSLPLFAHSDHKRICGLVLKRARDDEPERCSFRAIAQVADVGEKQVTRWASGEQMPASETWAEVLCYLGERSRARYFAMLEGRDADASVSRYIDDAISRLELAERGLGHAGADERVRICGMMADLINRASAIQTKCLPAKPREAA